MELQLEERGNDAACESGAGGDRGLDDHNESIDLEQMSSGEPQHLAKSDEEDETSERLHLRDFANLFRYATVLDWILYLIGIIMALAHGAVLPCFVYLFGEIIRAFINEFPTSNFLSTVNVDPTPLLSTISNNTSIFLNEYNNNSDFCFNLFPVYGVTVADAFDLLANLVSEPVRLNCSFLITNSSTFNDILINCVNMVECLTNEDFIAYMNVLTYAIVSLAIGVIICGMLQVFTFKTTSERQILKMRLKFFGSLLKQNIEHFDAEHSREYSIRAIVDTVRIQEGLGVKLSYFIQWMSSFIGSVILGFVIEWRVALAVFLFLPFLAVTAAAGAQFRAYYNGREQDEYAAAGALVEETLSAIETVVAFGGEKKDAERYAARLDAAKNFGSRKGFAVGVTGGISIFLVLTLTAFGFWIGGYLVFTGVITAYVVLVPIMAIVLGAYSLSRSIAPLSSFVTATKLAVGIIEIIDRAQKETSNEPSKPDLSNDVFDSSIELRNVCFAYPIRSEVQILNDLSLHVKVGQTVALVGPSGCGKSTIMQLLLRFYSANSGQILIGGKEIQSMSSTWLRENIGVVSQEPVLFDTTIAENIRLGKEDATMSEIIQAAKEANAHDFVSALPDGYHTLVGEKGSHLSGGQKQRIAIARALVRQPKIMLLDEATSALDSQSEATVQEALDKASQGRTTIIIAHHLSTIRNVDVIISLKEGKIVEMGTHEELMQSEGLYHDLVTVQSAGFQASHIGMPQSSTHQASFSRYTTKRRKRSATRTLRTTKHISTRPIPLRPLYYRRSHYKQSPPLFRGQSVIELNPNIRRKGSVLSSTILAMKRETQREEFYDNLPQPSFRKIMKLNLREWWLILIGCIGAILSGLVWPLFGLLLGFLLDALVNMDVVSRTHLPASLTILLGAISGFGYFVMIFPLSVSGERLTARLRFTTFEAMLKQEMGWFDEDKNSTASLSSILAEDANLIQKATGRQIGVVLQSSVTLLISLGVAFYYSWPLSLVMLGTLPFLIVAAVVEATATRKFVKTERNAAESAEKVIVECVEDIRTVVALNAQQHFYQAFKKNLSKSHRRALPAGLLHGLTYGLSSCIIFFMVAVVLPFGAYQVSQADSHIAFITFQNFFTVLLTIAMSGLVIGKTTAFIPKYISARVAASRVFVVLERESLIDINHTGGITLDEVSGGILADSLRFSYPSRPDDTVLNGLSLNTKPGKTLALVGPSGCGKSTIVSLFQRLYDASSGDLSLDGTDVKLLDLKWLRSQIGVVSQEPTLFDLSIEENIRYGALFRDVSDDEVVEAAKQANIHNFITSLPEGYNTRVGSSGTQMSGGQKQRIAIARALLRNPNILLLDEATSALDAESESVVQEALDRAQEGRTSIVIAHRLSTIKGADCIAVLQNGRVAETGTHDELIRKRGIYSKLDFLQNRLH